LWHPHHRNQITRSRPPATDRAHSGLLTLLNSHPTGGSAQRCGPTPAGPERALTCGGSTQHAHTAHTARDMTRRSAHSGTCLTQDSVQLQVQVSRLESRAVVGYPDLAHQHDAIWHRSRHPSALTHQQAPTAQLSTRRRREPAGYRSALGCSSLSHMVTHGWIRLMRLECRAPDGMGAAA